MMRRFYSGRRFGCIEVLLAVFLSAPISLHARIGFAGGGLPTPGSGRLTQRNEPSDTQMAHVSYSGVLKQVDDKSLVLQLGDGRILTIKVSPETKFYGNSREIESDDLKPGDHLTVQADEDQNNYLHATAVALQQAASGQTAQSSASSPASSSVSGGGDRPQLKRAPGQTAGDSATQQASAAGLAPASSSQAQAAPYAPPTQSQAQSTAPCSDAPPIMKRGKQADLPPCPDPPLAAAPVRSLSPTASLIERAREEAFEFSEKLPNFICEEFMSRFTKRGREAEMPLDVVSAEIIYDNAQESYRNVKIDDHATDKALQEIDGSWSTGEFASTLLELFHPDTDAQFRSGGASTIAGFSAQVYDFQVRGENSHWVVQSGSQSLNAAYEGSVWVDPQTARVLRIEMQARDIPPDFPMDTVESAVDYSYVVIGGTSFLLPVHAESLGCDRGTGYCSHNLIDFRNYHEYTSTIKIGP